MVPTSTQGRDSISIYAPIDLWALSASNKRTTSIQEEHYKKVPNGVSPLEGHTTWRKPCSYQKCMSEPTLTGQCESILIFYFFDGGVEEAVSQVSL